MAPTKPTCPALIPDKVEISPFCWFLEVVFPQSVLILPCFTSFFYRGGHPLTFQGVSSISSAQTEVSGQFYVIAVLGQFPDFHHSTYGGDLWNKPNLQLLSPSHATRMCSNALHGPPNVPRVPIPPLLSAFGNWLEHLLTTVLIICRSNLFLGNIIGPSWHEYADRNFKTSWVWFVSLFFLMVWI